MIAISFISFLIIFMVIGVLSVKSKKETLNDYFIASKSIGPLFVGLSGAATLLNGIMFFGNIGMTYILGFKFIWFYIGAILAHIISFKYIVEKFTQIGQKNNNATLLGFLTNNSKKQYKYFIYVAVLFVIVFSSIVASSQLLSGAKALNFFFNIEHYIGGAIVLGIVLIYCYAGGIRASIWTDVAQTVVMMAAMFTLAFYCIDAVGGFRTLISNLSLLNTNISDMFFDNMLGGWPMFLIGWLFMFLGTSIGSPQVAVRYLTIKNNKEIKKAGYYYTSYIFVFYTLAFIIGLSAKILIPADLIIDKELALITIASNLLPEFLIGVILAGIFASVISTADSLVLVSSAAIVKDLCPNIKKYNYAKIFTIISCILIYTIFIFGGKSVFSLLVLGYSMTASVFFPMVLLKILGEELNPRSLIIMMMTSIIIVLLWRYLGYHKMINECAIAIPSSFIIYKILKLTKKRVK